MKKIRHSKLPITLISEDHLTTDMLKAIQIQMDAYSWDDWIDEDGKWFKYWNKPNPKQMELFNETNIT
jgi:hypothetical protein|tara:strand:- start:110 stop:313 length:204 start_codon:yes stop_codon:yes gene_type:complete